MTEWQLIETAPRDETAVWLFCEGGVYIGYFDPPDPCLDRAGKWFLKAGFRRGVEGKPDEIFGTYSFGVQPTHWMPLPAPPQTTEDV